MIFWGHDYMVPLDIRSAQFGAKKSLCVLTTMKCMNIFSIKQAPTAGVLSIESATNMRLLPELRAGLLTTALQLKTESKES